jgi:membrane complex biogenesis BtpA family protein
MSKFIKLFPNINKPIIAMAHVPALPGTPLYDAKKGVEGLIDQVQKDTNVLVEAGFDAILFCNENDRPYKLEAGLESAAVMTRVVNECKPRGIPFGVDFLWDANCALAIAVATGASFIREVVSGYWESDMGPWAPDAAKLLRDRRNFGREDLAIFANVTPEFASSVGSRSAAMMAKSTVVSSLVDAILVSGPMAGTEPDLRILEEVRDSVPSEIPILLNTGAKEKTIRKFLQFADGCIVGSDLKRDGHTWNEVDPQRAQRFIRAAKNA